MFTRFTAPKSMRTTFVLLVVMASMLVGTLTAFGAATYKFNDRKLSLDVKSSGNIRVSGDRIVYLEKDKSGAQQLYVKSIKTGKAEQITKDDKYKEGVRIAGDEVFYLESVEKFDAKVHTFRKNLIRYNLKTKTKEKLFKEATYPQGLFVDGSYAVYKDMSNWIVLDLKTKKERTLKSGQIPLELAKGRLLIRSNEATFKDLLIIDLKSNREIPIYSVKEGEKLLDAAYNGTHVVWLKETKSMGDDGRYKYESTYTIMDRTKADAKLKVIKLPKGLQVQPKPLEFGTNYLAYTEMVDDKYIVRGLDLRNGGTFTYGTLDKRGDNVLFFQGNELLMRDKDGQLFLRNAVRSTAK